jgi:hypothetical protein
MRLYLLDTVAMHGIKDPTPPWYVNCRIRVILPNFKPLHQKSSYHFISSSPLFHVQKFSFSIPQIYIGFFIAGGAGGFL